MSEKLAVERYEPSQREQWDRLVSAARARHFMFQRGYMDYHADRFPDCSRVIIADGEPVAAFPASREGDEVVSHGGLTFGGLLSGPDLTAARTGEALDLVAASLRQDGVSRLVYKPVPHIYHVAPAEEDLFALHALGARLIRRDVTTAIPPDTEPHYTNMRRRAIKRARRSPLFVSVSDAVEEYMSLVNEVLVARHGVEPVHSGAEMRLLWERFFGQIRLFTATLDGTLLAGYLIYDTPRVAHAQYSVVGPLGRDLHAGDLLVDYLLNAVYQEKWFDFGISNERTGALNQGLVDYKESFGARAIVYDHYALEL